MWSIEVILLPPTMSRPLPIVANFRQPHALDIGPESEYIVFNLEIMGCLWIA